MCFAGFAAGVGVGLLVAVTPDLDARVPYAPINWTPSTTLVVLRDSPPSAPAYLSLANDPALMVKVPSQSAL